MLLTSDQWHCLQLLWWLLCSVDLIVGEDNRHWRCAGDLKGKSMDAPHAVTVAGDI
jgi:hypothetical protein